MSYWSDVREWRDTGLTLALGGAGAGLGWALQVPAYLLTGPALLVSLAGLWGVPLRVAPLARDIAFLVLGVGIGSTVTAETAGVLMRWPLAFGALALTLVLTMIVCQWLLRRVFGFDRKSAVLAAAPGHLSFVIGLSATLKVDVVPVTMVQAVRLLALTLIVPFLARAMGVEISGQPLSGSGVLPWGEFALLLAIALGVGLILQWLRLPAALLIGAMVVSAVAHGAGWSQGGLHPALGAVAFVTLGALIGTRFSGVTWAMLRASLAGGLAVTVVAAALAAIVAVPVALSLEMPASTVLAAFAPGGFETMVALGAVLGANPGFVATCHVARLTILTGLIPWFVARAERAEGKAVPAKGPHGPG